ncbi:MAG: hypothetical protein JXA90_15350, partial [Planctomycetes bacterium]|nr:hypothetical protein [Planctomycetota bacterium]
MKKPAQRELVFLSEIGVESCGEFGPKAERLARLLALGFPVPRGFCIESSELQRHIETHGLFPLIRQACARGADGGDAWRGPLGELRRRIIEEPLDDGLRRRIAAGLEKLGARSVAVRSSGLAEDSRVHSFAGLHDTVLAVRTDDECEEAVRACWASLFSERAFEYRRSCGIDGNRVAMAVLVEEQVTAEISGVAFGVDPAGRRLNQLVIELVRGSGSSLVSGRASPFRAKLSRSDLSILSTEGRDPGIEEVLAMRFPPAAGSRSEDPSSPLDRDELLRRVARLTLEAEAALGAPQDVEWAWDGERIHVLQSRPITPVGGARPWAAGQVWTNANAGEVIPDVVTPMTWSMVEPALVALFAGIFRLVGIDVRQITLVGRVAGRVYFNLNTAVGILRSVPFVKERDLGEMLGGMQVDPAGGSRVSIPDEDLPSIRISLLRLLLAVPRFIVWCLLHRPRRGEAFLKVLRRETDRMRERSRREISPLERCILLRDCFDIFSGDRDSLAYPMVGMIGFQSLDRVCRRWLASEGAMIAHRLVAGQRGVESAEAGLALWDLARAARLSPDV